MDYISVNGQLLPYENARIAPGDSGFLHGAGLFETLRAKNRKIFRLADHLARLRRSAEDLDLTFSLEQAQLEELAAELLEANDLTDARLRLTITRGDLHAIDEKNPTPPITLVLSAAAFQPYPQALYDMGLGVTVSKFKQNPENPLTGHKTTSYFDRLLALREAQAVGAGESLWFTLHDHYLAEGSISNVFLVDKDDLLISLPLTIPLHPVAATAPASPNSATGPTSNGHQTARLCLPGITRQLVLNAARDADILPHERLVTIHDLLAAREVFLTNAIMGVMPVVRIERHAVANEKPGELTRKLAQAYQKKLEEECS